MDLLIPLMPFFGALPIAVAAVVIDKFWRRQRDAPVAMLEAENQEMREELASGARPMLAPCSSRAVSPRHLRTARSAATHAEPDSHSSLARSQASESS
jgi:hypothetical protein